MPSRANQKLRWVGGPAFASFETQLATLGPTFWWKLNEASGNFTDSGSGAKNLTAHGTIAYNQSGPGLPGLAVPSVQFATNGTAGYGETASITNAFSGGTNILTLGLWIKGAATNTTWGLTANNFSLFVQGIWGTSSHQRGTFDLSSGETFFANPTLFNNTWQFLVATASLSAGSVTQTTYLNGSQVGTLTAAGSFGDATTNIYLGVPSGGSGTANMFMCEAFVFQGTALTPTQISNLYKGATLG